MEPATASVRNSDHNPSVKESDHNDHSNPEESSALSSALVCTPSISIQPPNVPSLDNCSASSGSSMLVSTSTYDKSGGETEGGNVRINGGIVEEISNTNAYDGTEEIYHVGVEQFEECAENEDDQEDDDSIL